MQVAVDGSHGDGIGAHTACNQCAESCDNAKNRLPHTCLLLVDGRQICGLESYSFVGYHLSRSAMPNLVSYGPPALGVDTITVIITPVRARADMIEPPRTSHLST